MDSQESQRVAAALARLATPGANAMQIADAIASTWQGIDAVLHPIIGREGVAALYKRSVYLTGADHPWLAGLDHGVVPALDVTPLTRALAQQSSALAAAGGGALLQNFHELLASMIGPALTEQMLPSVWENLFNGLPAQDPSS